MPVLILSALILALSIAGSTWIYLEGTRALRAQAKAVEVQSSQNQPNRAEPGVVDLLKEMNAWAIKVTTASAASGIGLTVVMIAGLHWWRRSWARRLVVQTQAWEKEVRCLEGVRKELEIERTHRKRAEEDSQRTQKEIDKRVEERTATLAKSYELLQEELSERKMSEKVLAQQTKELERSKDVLELHVQARTQELQKLKGRYELILNSAGEGIYGLDLKGKTTFVNPAAAKLTGWKVEEVIGKLEGEIFYRNQANGSPDGQTLLKDQNGEHLNDQVFVRKDGAAFPVEYVRSPILEKDRLVGAVVMFKDITERKRTEEALARKAAELSRSNNELEQFAYVASHDLQEPLRKIQAFGDRLKTKCDAVNLQEGRDYLERMQSAAARMQTLINDLLTFSRVISASQPFVQVDLGAVTKEVLTDLEVRIEQTKAKVEVGSLTTIDADPLQMRQLLQNLIGNALKFQTPGTQPVIKVQAQIQKDPLGGVDGEPGHDLCELTIQDNGIGFEEKYIDKIFAVFQRLHGRNEYEGTGVGLAVCRRITDRHGGTINARSKLGEGATFIVTLPVRQTKKEAPCDTPA